MKVGSLVGTHSWGGASAAIAWAVPLVIFGAHAALFGTWLVDDAGISFAYARSLSGGHGLVAQPGVQPVEGFSNPLWVALYTVPYSLGLMRLPWTPKLVALALTGLTFWLLARTFREDGAGPVVPFVAACALALNTSAKGGPGVAAVRGLLLLEPGALATAALAARAWVSGLGSWWLLLMTGGTTVLFVRRAPRAIEIGTLLLTGAGLAIFVLLPPDWMGEFRFAFGFLVTSALLVPLLGAALLTEGEHGPRRAIATGLIVIWLGTVCAAATLRTPRFASDPTVPLSLVLETVGERFNRIAERLGVEHGSILTPDVGGALLASRLRVYDLGQLTDRTIAATADERAAEPHPSSGPMVLRIRCSEWPRTRKSGTEPTCSYPCAS